MGKAKKPDGAKNTFVDQAELSKVQSNFKKLVKSMQKKKYTETCNKMLLNKFKLLNLINEMIFAKQDYDEWLMHRIHQ
jgi:hypothetical protein